MTVIYVDFKTRRVQTHTPETPASVTVPAVPASPYGSKYDAEMPCRDIAKRLRKELSQDFPGWKFSVHSSYRNITVRITSIPDHIPLYNPEWVERERACNWGTATPRYSQPVREAIQHINDWLREYNYDKSDITTDYFDVKFYSDTGVCYTFEDTRSHERG
jgi:hypothetical protein